MQPIIKFALLAVFAALAAVTLGASWHEMPGPTPAPRVMVIYVGADDCAPCQVWHRAYWPQFRDSPEFRLLAYREVRSPNLFKVLNQDLWPEDIVAYRKNIAIDSGIPLWLVTANDEMVLMASGVSQWEVTMVPAIRRLVRR